MLDEPLTALDPVARADLMASVVESAREDGISVVLSSHVLAELERVATYLVVLGRGGLRRPVPWASLALVTLRQRRGALIGATVWLVRRHGA